MAQVAETVHQHAELILGIALDQWGRLRQVEAEIDQWNLIDQIVFIEEWPLEEQRLRMLEEYVAQGALTAEQLARYGELKRLVARNRPIIHRLRQS